MPECVRCLNLERALDREARERARLRRELTRIANYAPDWRGYEDAISPQEVARDALGLDREAGRG